MQKMSQHNVWIGIFRDSRQVRVRMPFSVEFASSSCVCMSSGCSSFFHNPKIGHNILPRVCDWPYLQGVSHTYDTGTLGLVPASLRPCRG